MLLSHIAVSGLPPVPYKTVETVPEKASVIVLLQHVNVTMLPALSCDAPLKRIVSQGRSGKCRQAEISSFDKYHVRPHPLLGNSHVFFSFRMTRLHLVKSVGLNTNTEVE